jgi:hypothetical protein
MPSTFHIATVANDLSMYGAMRLSMAACGFTEPRCRFTLFDNSQSNRYDPYAVLRQLAGDGDEPYIVLCHQDLLFKAESTVDLLERRLTQLEQIDPHWAVAGNAGVDSHWKLQAYLDEPNGNHRSSPLPAAVVSLDENLLILRRSHYVLPSPAMSGFHLYGADLCLNAFMQHRTSYVIEFLIQHLSKGNPESDAFIQAEKNLVQVWRSQLMMGLIRTPCAMLQVASTPWLNKLLASGKVRDFLRTTGICRIPRIGLRRRTVKPAGGQ